MDKLKLGEFYLNKNINALRRLSYLPLSCNNYEKISMKQYIDTIRYKEKHLNNDYSDVRSGDYYRVLGVDVIWDVAINHVSSCGEIQGIFYRHSHISGNHMDRMECLDLRQLFDNKTVYKVSDNRYFMGASNIYKRTRNKVELNNTDDKPYHFKVSDLLADSMRYAGVEIFYSIKTNLPTVSITI